MLTNVRNRRSLISVIVLYAVLFSPFVLEFYKYRHKDMSFDGSGFLILLTTALVSGYLSILAYLLLGEELDSGRIKLWFSLPISREKVLIRVCNRMFINGTLVSLFLYANTVVIISFFFGIPCKPFVIGLGIVQLASVLMTFGTAITVFLRGKYIVLFGIVLPVTRLFMYIQMSILQKASPTGNNAYIMELIMPLGVGFRNIAYGHTPLMIRQKDLLIFTNMGGFIENIYPFIWVLIMLMLIARKIKYTDY